MQVLYGELCDCVNHQGRVLLKVVNPNVDVNVDVDVNPFRYFHRQNSCKLRLRLCLRLDLRPLVKLGPSA